MTQILSFSKMLKKTKINWIDENILIFQSKNTEKVRNPSKTTKLTKILNQRSKDKKVMLFFDDF